MQKLEDYIKENFANKAEFARVNKVHAPQVSLWIRLGYKVSDKTIFKPMREIISVK